MNGTLRGKVHLKPYVHLVCESSSGVVWCQQGRSNDCMLTMLCTSFSDGSASLEPVWQVSSHKS